MPSELDRLYASYDACARCRALGNPLRHILGGGQSARPKFLFLFINPTHHNISSRADYPGIRRYPFLGVRYFWKLMAEAGAIDRRVVVDIYKNGWRTEHERIIEDDLRGKSIYVTNLVKCTQPNGDNPSKEVISADLPFLHQEISLVAPEHIVAFGKLPIRALTGRDVRLGDCLMAARQKKSETLKAEINGQNYPVFPCYFPVGRGNPPKAIEMLRYVLRAAR